MTKQRRLATKITFYNMIIIITPDCPRELADCAIRCLDRRGPVYVAQDSDYSGIYPSKIPRFSRFVGQLGAKMR
jgi:hypothetical protein